MPSIQSGLPSFTAAVIVPNAGEQITAQSIRDNSQAHNNRTLFLNVNKGGLSTDNLWTGEQTWNGGATINTLPWDFNVPVQFSEPPTMPGALRIRTASSSPMMSPLAEWTVDILGRAVALSESAQGVLYPLDIPAGATITSYTLMCNPPAHSLMPAVKQRIQILSVGRDSASFDVEDETFDSASTVGPYSAVHILMGTCAVVADLEARAYYLRYMVESGSNSALTGLELWSPGVATTGGTIWGGVAPTE